MNQAVQFWIGILSVVCLAALAVISGPPYFSNASRPVRGVAAPFLAIESAHDASDVDSVLSESPSPDREAMRLKRYADFAFLVFYAALFVALARMMGRMAWMAAALALLAAACGAFENAAILRLLDLPLSGTTQARIDAIRHPGMVKWALDSLAAGLVGALLLRQRQVALRAAGSFYLAAALLGLYGLSQDAFNAWSGLPLPGAFVTLAILYFRPRRGYRIRA